LPRQTSAVKDQAQVIEITLLICARLPTGSRAVGAQTDQMADGSDVDERGQAKPAQNTAHTVSAEGLFVAVLVQPAKFTSVSLRSRLVQLSAPLRLI